MSETTQEVTQEVTQSTANPFDDSSWVETSPVQQIATEQETGSVQTEQTQTTQTETQETQVAETTTQVDYNSFVKENFGYESLDEAKAEFEQLKKLKETAPQEQKFANDESKAFYQALLEGKTDDVLNFLSTQKKIEKLATSEVDAYTAEEIIKMNIKQKNKNLSDDEVDFVFSERFSMPKKPVQGTDEYDDAYQERVSEWESKFQAAQKKLIIEAKMAQPEIEKIKSELVLPSIQTPNQVSEAQMQEELQQAEEMRKEFEQTLEKEYKSFSGFNVTFKDESAGIEIPISYVPTDEEKVSLKQELSDFDYSEYFGSRWFSKEGKPEIKNMMADKYFLENKEKILQKVANEAAQQMRLKMIALQSNINLKGNNGQQQTFTPNNNQSETDKFAAVMFGA
ncbi:MAG: hypothetical protein B7Y37_13830 [Sphingobacteriia bacterium 28-36-52]|nr:MAG: hypothetical protein B7Y37_13830 [Sphingobacteriia bacterium 28-36-52]